MEKDKEEGGVWTLAASERMRGAKKHQNYRDKYFLEFLKLKGVCGPKNNHLYFVSMHSFAFLNVKKTCIIQWLCLVTRRQNKNIVYSSAKIKKIS